MTDPTPPPAYWSPSTDEGWIVDSDGVLFEATIVGDPITLPADAVRLIAETPSEGFRRYVAAERDACLAEIKRITTAHEASLARVTAERDEARAQHAAVLAQRDSWWETVGAQKQALRDENAQLRAQRAADLADLRAAAQDLRTIGVLVNDRRSAAYELAAERVDQVIARINHRAGETTDGD